MAVIDMSRSHLMDALRQALPWARERFGLYMTSGRYWLVVLTASVMTGHAGPFGLHMLLPVPMRVLMWIALLVPVVPLILGLSLVFRETARRLDIAWGWAALAAGLVSVLPVALYAAIVDTPFLAPEDQLPFVSILHSIAAPVVLITVVVNAFFPTLQPLWGLRRTPSRTLPTGHEDFGAMFDPPASTTGTASAALPRQAMEASPLFERLPAELGQDVVCIRADNHHVEVTTALGQARVLMRLGDAEADLAAYPGLRVHRSWWVNLAHVTALGETAGRDGGSLTLSTGAAVPVSRSQRPAVIEALNRHEHRGAD